MFQEFGVAPKKIVFSDATRPLCMSLLPCCNDGGITDVNAGAEKIQDQPHHPSCVLPNCVS